MTNTLYEISADFLAALDAIEVDPDTGELLNADQLMASAATSSLDIGTGSRSSTSRRTRKGECSSIP